jgi:acetylornithine deacetylase
MPGLKTTLIPEHQQGPPHDAGLRGEPRLAVVKAVNRAYREVRGADQPTGAITPPGFYGTDAAHLYHAPGWRDRLRPGGRYNTMPDERVDIPDFLDAVRVYLLAILDVCELA